MSDTNDISLPGDARNLFGRRGEDIVPVSSVSLVCDGLLGMLPAGTPEGYATAEDNGGMAVKDCAKAAAVAVAVHVPGDILKRIRDDAGSDGASSCYRASHRLVPCVVVIERQDFVANAGRPSEPAAAEIGLIRSESDAISLDSAPTAGPSHLRKRGRGRPRKDGNGPFKADSPPPEVKETERRRLKEARKKKKRREMESDGIILSDFVSDRKGPMTRSMVHQRRPHKDGSGAFMADSPPPEVKETERRRLEETRKKKKRRVVESDRIILFNSFSDRKSPVIRSMDHQRRPRKDRSGPFETDSPPPEVRETERHRLEEARKKRKRRKVESNRIILFDSICDRKGPVTRSMTRQSRQIEEMRAESTNDLMARIDGWLQDLTTVRSCRTRSAMRDSRNLNLSFRYLRDAFNCLCERASSRTAEDFSSERIDELKAGWGAKACPGEKSGLSATAGIRSGSASGDLLMVADVRLSESFVGANSTISDRLSALDDRIASLVASSGLTGPGVVDELAISGSSESVGLSGMGREANGPAIPSVPLQRCRGIASAFSQGDPSTSTEHLISDPPFISTRKRKRDGEDFRQPPPILAERSEKRFSALAPASGSRSWETGRNGTRINAPASSTSCLSLSGNSTSHHARERRLIKRLPQVVSILVTDQEKASYTDVLRRVRAGISLENIGIARTRIRQAASGALLVELPGASPQQADTLVERIRSIFRRDETVKVSRPIRKVHLRISEFDPSVMTDDVAVAIVAASDGEVAVADVRVGEPLRDFGGLNFMRVQCPAPVGLRLALAGRLSLGSTSVRVALMKSRSPRCFKCHGVGHLQQRCPSLVDLTGCCFSCGKEGHSAVVCKRRPHCPLCKSRGLLADHCAGGPECRPCPPRREPLPGRVL